MDEPNPYQGPATQIVDVPLVRQIESASKARRFFNWLIDKLVMFGLAMVVMLMASLAWGDPVLEWVEGMNKPTEYAVDYALAFVYYTLLEGLFGVSVGKLITGTRVVDAEGRRLTFPRALLRSLCRMIPFDALSLLLSEDDVRRAWHDSITRTYVVMRPRIATPVLGVESTA